MYVAALGLKVSLYTPVYNSQAQSFILAENSTVQQAAFCVKAGSHKSYLSMMITDPWME